MRSVLTALQEGRLFELPDTGKPRSLTFLARILDANPDIEVGTDAIEEIQLREQECNTGIGLGVAVPHVRARRDEGELYCAIGWSAQGIDYGAQDNALVHLVFMYYIPGAQKNVYLKEISTLIKAVRKSGGMEPIAHATDLNQVRNLLLDWVSIVAGDNGPEAVARMIKLDLKHVQAPAAASEATGGAAAPIPPGSAELTPQASPAQVITFSVLIVPPGNIFVLSHDGAFGALLERESNVGSRLAAGAPLAVGGRHIFVTGTAHYPGDRFLYYCVGVIAPS